MSYFTHLTVRSMKAGLASVSSKCVSILLHRQMCCVMEICFLEIAIDLILTLHPTLMIGLVWNSIVTIIQTLPPWSPVNVPGMRKTFLEGLCFGFPAVTAAMYIVPWSPALSRTGSGSSKPALLEDRSSNHPLAAPLSASKLPSPFQIMEKDVTIGTKGHVDTP